MVPAVYQQAGPQPVCAVSVPHYFSSPAVYGADVSVPGVVGWPRISSLNGTSGALAVPRPDLSSAEAGLGGRYLSSFEADLRGRYRSDLPSAGAVLEGRCLSSAEADLGGRYRLDLSSAGAGAGGRYLSPAEDGTGPTSPLRRPVPLLRGG